MNAQLIRIIGSGGWRWRITRKSDGELIVERELRDQMGSKIWFTVQMDHAKPIVKETVQMLLEVVAQGDRQ